LNLGGARVEEVLNVRQVRNCSELSATCSFP
jgi:hypothetical protein